MESKRLIKPKIELRIYVKTYLRCCYQVWMCRLCQKCYKMIAINECDIKRASISLAKLEFTTKTSTIQI